MERFQWIVALTRIMSAVFRKGGDVTPGREMKAVFDPKGGYFKGQWRVHAASLVAELGMIIEAQVDRHDARPGMSDHQRADRGEAPRAYEQRSKTVK